MSDSCLNERTPERSQKADPMAVIFKRVPLLQVRMGIRAGIPTVDVSSWKNIARWNVPLPCDSEIRFAI